MPVSAGKDRTLQSMQDERCEMMVTMMEMEAKMAMAGRRHLRRQVGIAGIVWWGRVVPSQGKVSSYSALHSWRTLHLASELCPGIW